MQKQLFLGFMVDCKKSAMLLIGRCI